MKRLLICFSILALAPFFMMGQKVVNERDVPQRLITDFRNRAPEAKNPKWEQLDSLNYRVSYIVDDEKMSLKFSNVSVETRWDVRLEWMPAKIKEYIDTTYAKSKVQSLCIADVQNVKRYEANIKQKKKEYLLRFELDGKFVDAVETNAKKKK